MVLKINQTISEVTEISVLCHDKERVNSVKTLYSEERQESKMPTFALTL